MLRIPLFHKVCLESIIHLIKIGNTIALQKHSTQFTQPTTITFRLYIPHGADIIRVPLVDRIIVVVLHIAWELLAELYVGYIHYILGTFEVETL